MNKNSSARIPESDIHRKVDKLCDEIESLWAMGESPDTASIIESLDHRTVPFFLKELVQLDFDLRQKDISLLRQRYETILPDQNTILNQIFNDLEKRVWLGLTNVATSLIDRHPYPAHIENYVGKKIGQYLIEERLGGGGFGVVYVARDEYLPRKVVIKIPILGSLATEDGVEAFMDEARNAARLRHPNILNVLHVGVDSSLPYIVQEYFEGGDLEQALRQRKFSLQETIEFIATLAEAIGYAHENKTIHRDIKPANILIDKDRKPIIADFGLSLHEPQLRGQAGEMVGTIRFMSPEQVRGEAHRLDGRTDIWSIGVILYLMLVDQYPFDGNDIEQISNAILMGSPCPPRQLNSAISRELDRISLKCLAVPVIDRYSTAFDLAEDLRFLLDRIREPQSEKNELVAGEKKKLIPKGLAAFDIADRDFFLDLLPGPKDRDGIPDSIRFWKNQIENPELSNSVNLLFGPSGSGKSSLIHAGLIPVLDPNIITVSIESTPHDTEVRFLKAIKSEVPAIPNDLSLPEIVSDIRRGKYLPGHRRLLIVFDQFEQWLHTHPNPEHTQIVHAMRQCDGKRIQAIILAREDFWMAITRFFRHLEIDLVERENFASVDLFSKRHAKDVLAKFGQAFGNLPENIADFTDSQKMFLDKAIDLLAEKDSVICVRSALFAETVKGREWEIGTLKQLGNAKNIGIEFLDQFLGDQSSNPTYKYYRQKLITILESLLPNSGVEIKGNLQSVDSLAKASGLNSGDSEFRKLIKILDNELRLITPTEPDVGHVESSTSESYYQLTHDYLVPSIREWIEKEHGRTIQGRSLRKLNELSEQWHQAQHSRFLPGLLEYLSMLRNIPHRMMSNKGKTFLWHATKYFGVRFLGLVAMVVIITSVIVNQDRTAMVTQFLNCSHGALPTVVGDVGIGSRSYARRIRQRIATGLKPAKERRARLVLAFLKQASDEDIQYLIDKIPETPGIESQNLNRGLMNYSDQSIRLIDKALQSKPDHSNKLFIQRAHLDPQRSLSDKLEFIEDPSARTDLIFQYKTWRGDISQCLAMLQAERTAPELHGLCIMFGQIGPEEFNETDFGNILDFVTNQYQNHTSSAVHSAAMWAINRWGRELPEIGALERDNVRQWWINELGMTMIKVKNGPIPGSWRSQFPATAEKVKPGTIEGEFFVSQFEVTNELFQRFLDDDYSELMDGFVLPENTQPSAAVTNLTIEEAVLFCNWLSYKCGLKPAYRKEAPVAEDESSFSRWVLVPDSNGYRLPNMSQWELAARGGIASTESYFSNDKYFAGFGDYFWCRLNSEDKIQPVGLTIPNQLGIFDVIGNAYEFTFNSPADDDAEYSEGSFGGSYDSSISNCCIFNGQLGWLFLSKGKRSELSGIRVVLPAK